MIEKRGRKSVEELSLVHLASARKPIEPPATLKAAEAKIFRDVVASCAVNHFRMAFTRAGDKLLQIGLIAVWGEYVWVT